MAIRVVEFLSGGGGFIKFERFLPNNQHTQGKFLNFENWTNFSREKDYFHSGVSPHFRAFVVRSAFSYSIFLHKKSK